MLHTFIRKVCQNLHLLTREVLIFACNSNKSSNNLALIYEFTSKFTVLNNIDMFHISIPNLLNASKTSDSFPHLGKKY